MPIIKRQVKEDNFVDKSNLDELREHKIQSPISLDENKIIDNMQSIMENNIVLEADETPIPTIDSLKTKLKQYTSEKKLEEYLRYDMNKKISNILSFSFLSRTAVKKPNISIKELKQIHSLNNKMKEEISDVYRFINNKEQVDKLSKALKNLDISDSYINDKIEITNNYTITIDTDEIEVEESSIKANMLPYFTLNEIQKRVDITPDMNISLSKDIQYKDWVDEMKLLQSGFVSESYSYMYSLWVDKIYELQKENTDINKKSVLALGWNPELPFNVENRLHGTERFKSKLESFNNILNISNITTPEMYLNESIMDKALQPIYVVVTYTKSIFGKVTRAITDAVYTHSGLSLSSNLDKIYSYNISEKGFSIEDLNSYNHEDGCVMALYTILINNEQMKKIKYFLNDQIHNIASSKYSVPNLLGILLNKPIHIDNAMVCSQFVDNLLKKINIDITKKDSALVTPQDFRNSKSKFMIKLYEGPISKYNPKKIEPKLAMVMRSKFKSIDESVIQEKELPIRFNDNGDLLISKIGKIDYEEEYAKTHKLLVTYKKANNLDGIKSGLCRLWFMNCLIQEELYNKKITDDKKNELNKARAKILNDFTTYSKLLGNFDFMEYYNNSPYSDVLKIDNPTMKHTSKIGKGILKTLFM